LWLSLDQKNRIALQAVLVIPCTELAPVFFQASTAALGFITDLVPAVGGLPARGRLALFLNTHVSAGTADGGAFGQGQGRGILEAVAGVRSAHHGIAGIARAIVFDAHTPETAILIESLQLRAESRLPGLLMSGKRLIYMIIFDTAAAQPDNEGGPGQEYQY
jgi:hypothetical protein